MDTSGRSTLVRFTDRLEPLEASGQDTADEVAARAAAAADGAPARTPEAGTEEAESFGRWLRAQRERRGVRLREIADRTKISLRYFQALEEDRFEILPAPVFAKGFLRQYAECVGLDPEAAVRRFESAAADDQGGEQPAPPPPAGSTPVWAYGAAVGLVLAALVAIVWGVSQLGRDQRREPAEDAPAAAGSPLPAEAPEDRLADEPRSAAPPVAAAGAPLVVTLDFAGECWVETAVDGRRRVGELKVQGEALKLEAEERVELKVGNASVVEIAVNGHPYRFDDDATTTVREVRIDLETARALADGSD